MGGNRFQALLIDLDGVVYQGEQIVPGAVDALAWLEGRGVPLLFVTNTTSRPLRALLGKLDSLGIGGIRAEQILTPPSAAMSWLPVNAPGPAALFVPEATREDFADIPLFDPRAATPVASVVVGDLGEAWSFSRLNEAFRLLMSQAAPVLVALGLTRYWRAADGLRLDAGPFVKALEYASGRDAVVLGKPSAAFFNVAVAKLGCVAPQVVMVGDDVVSDVGGAQEAGLCGVLVRTGKFTARDLAGDLQPDAVLDSIADLPRWWERQS